jgi:hypothetical protein
MHVLPGMSYSELKEMNWKELSKWRAVALGLFRHVHGVVE